MLTGRTRILKKNFVNKILFIVSQKTFKIVISKIILYFINMNKFYFLL